MQKTFVGSVAKHIRPSIAINYTRDVRLGVLINQGMNFLRHEHLLWQDNSQGILRPTTTYIELIAYCPRDCDGCYITEENRKDKSVISMENADKIVILSRNIGIRLFTLLGGEPMSDETVPVIRHLLENNPDLTFIVCTNGDYIATKKGALDDILLRNNLSVSLSIDGFQGTNDLLRGRNSYANVASSARYLKSQRCLFGATTTLRPHNYLEPTSEEFIDHLKKMGFKFVAYSFTDDLGQAARDEAIERIEQIHGPVLLYTALFGYSGERNTSSLAKVVSIDRHGTILDHRRKRVEIGDISHDLSDIARNARWREKYLQY